MAPALARRPTPWPLAGRSVLAAISALCLALPAGSCAPETVANHQRVQVYLSAPVAGATVYLWWLDGDGYPLRKDATRHATRELGVSRAVASGVTDESGAVVIDDASFVYGTFVLMARGGSYVDPWLVAEGSSPEEATLALTEPGSDFALWSVVTDYIPPRQDEAATFVVSPLTTLARAVAERRLLQPADGRESEALWYETMRDTSALLGTHLGGVDLTQGPLPAWLPGLPEPAAPVAMPVSPVTPVSDDVSSLVLDDRTRHGLVLVAFPSLARQMAQAAGIPVRSFHARHLLALLLEDAASPDGGLLDGIGPAGSLVAGVCELPSGCAAGDAMCRAICVLDSNTLRADLASSLAFDFLGSALDRTDLTLADVLPLIEYLRTNQEPRLFGHDAPVIELGGPRPSVRVLPTTVHDELGDTIVFDERGVPVHTAGPGTVPVELGAPDDTLCPVVHKFAHRLDDPGDNAIRWQFEVVDQRGAGIDPGIGPGAGMYRLRLRAPGAPGQDAGQLLTDWLPATALDSVPDGVRYEVVLVRSQVPALGTVSGEFEIEFRGADALGLETMPARRCWQHVVLAAPLQVRSVAEATGEGSLHEANLEPGNNLAPLLDGVPLEQGRSVLDVEIANGTAEGVYVTLSIEQALATFRKSWQKTNALVDDAGESDCLITGDCTFNFPPDRRTVIVTDEAGTMEGLVSGLLVQDVITAQLVTPCAGCDAGEYRIEPRFALGDPRVYRVRFVVTDLRVLAPQPLGVSFGPFTDVSLDPEVLPISITGRTFGRFRSCEFALGEPLRCMFESVYQHYVALTEATVSLPGIHLLGRTSPLPALPPLMPPAQPDVLGAPVGLEMYQWSTTETTLPPPNP